MKISNTYNFAKQFLSKENYKKPIINTEPGYEGHRHGYRKGRFDESDIRKETYLIILGGAKAGIGYGAHRVWMCHKRKMQFNNIQFSSIPFDFGTALKFKGAWDVAFCKKLYERYDMHRLQPCQITQKYLEDVLEDMKKSIEFYTKYFGFEVIYQTIEGKDKEPNGFLPLKYVMIKNGNLSIELLEPSETTTVK